MADRRCESGRGEARTGRQSARDEELGSKSRQPLGHHDRACTSHDQSYPGRLDSLLLLSRGRLGLEEGTGGDNCRYESVQQLSIMRVIECSSQQERTLLARYIYGAVRQVYLGYFGSRIAVAGTWASMQWWWWLSCLQWVVLSACWPSNEEPCLARLALPRLAFPCLASLSLPDDEPNGMEPSQTSCSQWIQRTAWDRLAQAQVPVQILDGERGTGINGCRQGLPLMHGWVE
ncbi:hypothetical protein V8C44DRAFT_305053 [Trichoderma aethiopicum]